MWEELEIKLPSEGALVYVSKGYFSSTLMASAGQFNLHSEHAEQLLGFTIMGRSSNHSKTPKVQASTHFLQQVHML